MILFVGDQPSNIMKPGAKPFEGAKCEKRLKDWVKFLCDNEQTARIINRVDDSFKVETALASIYGVSIVALGNNASKALSGFSHFKLPHPSFLNRKCNDQEVVMSQLESCKSWLTGQPDSQSQDEPIQGSKVVK